MFFKANPFRSQGAPTAEKLSGEMRVFRESWQTASAVAGQHQAPLLEAHADQLRRVANFVISAEFILNPRLTSAELQQREDQFYQLMVSGDVVPSVSLLQNAGHESGRLAAAYVLPVEDHTESIYEAVKQAALIQKSGASATFSFSNLRPRNDRLSAHPVRVASGPVAFMRVFDAAAEAIENCNEQMPQPHMAVLAIDHPDILEFLDLPQSPQSVLGQLRLAVGVSDAFMQALQQDEEYLLIHPQNRKAYGKLRARQVWDRLLSAVHATGMPDILFLDRMNQANPTPHVGIAEVVSPSTGQVLLPYESSLAASINLRHMVHPRTRDMDWARLRKTAALAVRFLDNVIEINAYLLPQVEKLSRGNRKMALSVMGFASALDALGVSYTSNEALRLADQVMHVVHAASHDASEKLSEERGVFPNYQGSFWDGKRKLRNASITSVFIDEQASSWVHCSPGIEPAGSPYEIPAEWQLRLQATFQKYVDSTVWRKVCVPEQASLTELADITEKAFALGCKGVMVQRQGVTLPTARRIPTTKPRLTRDESGEAEEDNRPHIVRPTRPPEPAPTLDIAMMRRGKGLVQSYEVNAAAAETLTPPPQPPAPRKPVEPTRSQAKLSFTSSSGQYEVQIHEDGAEIKIHIKPLT